MKLQLNIADDLYDTYEKQAKSVKKSVELFIMNRLFEFKDLAASDRYLLLNAEDRNRLEKILGIGTLNTPEQLLTKVNSLNAVNFGGAEFNLSEAELKELHRMAEREKTTPEIEMQKRLDIIRPLIFNSAQFIKRI